MYEMRCGRISSGLCLQLLRLLGYGMDRDQRKGKNALHRHAGSPSTKPEYKELGKFAYGEIELEEGSRFNGVVRGMTKKKRKEIMAAGKLPVPCHAAIYQRQGYKTVVFDLDEEE